LKAPLDGEILVLEELNTNGIQKRSHFLKRFNIKNAITAED
jgi:hypothetical protein